MKIAVIGAGFFGSTIALKLSKKHSVDLYEKKGDILNCASKFNQFRYHLGFHYPRSQKTIDEIELSHKEFVNFYTNKVFGKTKNYYGVAEKNSKISYKKYLSILDKFNLNYKKTKKKFNGVSNLILTNEKVLNYFKFKKILKKKIINSKVNLILNTRFKKKDVTLYDKIIICCYSANNEIINNLSSIKIKNKKRYELVEKIIIKLPVKYKNESYVIIDGNFVCIDPYLGTNYHLLSDVKHSKIEIIKKINPNFSSFKNKFLTDKIYKDIKISNFKKFINHGSLYLPFLKLSKYIGSMFVVRTLKQNVEKTDNRVGKIEKIDNKFISIFSGKWNTCVSTANKLDGLLNK